jgi:hypothetical protein
MARLLREKKTRKANTPAQRGRTPPGSRALSFLPSKAIVAQASYIEDGVHDIPQKEPWIEHGLFLFIHCRSYTHMKYIWWFEVSLMIKYIRSKAIIQRSMHKKRWVTLPSMVKRREKRESPCTSRKIWAAPIDLSLGLLATCSETKRP